MVVTPKKPLYQPDSQQTARFSIPPIRRIEIPLWNVDRSQGELIPQIEGEAIYIERADYPVLIGLVTQSGTTDQSLVAARDGLTIKGPFKNLVLVHPPLGTSAALPWTLSLIVTSRVGDDVANELGGASSRFGICSRLITNTALAQQVAIFVPPGARQLDFLRVGVTATTVTDALMQAQNSLPATISVPSTITQQLGSGVQTYNQATNHQVYGVQVAGALAAGRVLVDFPPFPLPSFCRELLLTFTTTGATGTVNFHGRWS